MVAKCQLLSGFFALSLQACLALVALATLVYKRYLERPQRTWTIWGLDVGKQVFGGIFIHFANIGLSMLLENDTVNSNQCIWYFLNFFIDCTLGVFIVYLIHSWLQIIMVKLYPLDSSFEEIGYYGHPSSLYVWFQQLKIWILALGLNKLFVVVFLFSLQQEMIDFGNALFRPLKPYPRVELLVVMLICPWILQILQFWLFDCFLKARTPGLQGFESLNRPSQK